MTTAAPFSPVSLRKKLIAGQPGIDESELHGVWALREIISSLSPALGTRPSVLEASVSDPPRGRPVWASGAAIPTRPSRKQSALWIRFLCELGFGALHGFIGRPVAQASGIRSFLVGPGAITAHRILGSSNRKDSGLPSPQELQDRVLGSFLAQTLAIESARRWVVNLGLRWESIPDFLSAADWQSAEEENTGIEDLLYEHENRFRLAFANAAVGLALNDPEGHFLEVNRAYCRITGYTPEELNFLSFQAITHPDDLPGNLQLRDQLLSGERESVVVEKRYRTKAGAVVWVQNSSAAVRDEAGVVSGIITLTEDITERKRAQEALKESEAQFRSLVDRLPFGICRTTRDGKLLMVNPALVRMLGYGSEQVLLAKDLAQDIFLDPGEQERILSGCEQTTWNPRCDLQLPWKRRDGKPILVNVKTGIVPNGDESGPFFELTVEDVTERSNLENAFQQAQRMDAIGQLAGGIAHDFNNLLTIILGQSDFILRKTDSSDPWHPRLCEIRDAADRARWLTSQLLVYSRRHTMEYQVVDPNELLQELRQMFERLLSENILLISELSPGLGHVRTDGKLLQQSIINLVVNARDAMPKGGVLEIKTANVEVGSTAGAEPRGVPPGAYVVLSVRDTGTGMSPEVLEHIFEPYFTTKAPGKGTGLGLAMLHGIIKQSGGYVTVRSGLGQGSTFSVFLPSVKAPLDPVPTTGQVEIPVGNETCLVVEDSAGVRSIACEYLAEGGYTVLEAKDGAQALALAREHEGPIHLLLSDVVLPGMSGPELGRCLATHQPEIKTLLVSGYANETAIEHGVLDPASSLLTKPFTQAELLRKVRQVLDGQPAVSR